MAGHISPLKKISASDRLAIALLRGTDVPDVDGSDFDRLRIAAQMKGMHILAPGCRYFGRDEIMLMAWIAQLQRRQLTPDIVIDPGMRRILAACADRLYEMGITLDFRMIARGRAIAEPRSTQSTVPVPVLSAPDMSCEARALAMAEQNGSITSRELLRIGLSRRMISLLCRRNKLRQVRFGVYIRVEQDNL